MTLFKLFSSFPNQVTKKPLSTRQLSPKAYIWDALVLPYISRIPCVP